MKFKTFFLCFLAAMVVSSCEKEPKKRIINNPGAQISDMLQGTSMTLPLPQVPKYIQGTEDITRYMGTHFWEALDFNDTVKSLDENFMSQCFADFTVALAAQPDSSALHNSVLAFLDRASVNEKALALAKNIAERSVGNHESPLRSDGQWKAFVEILSKDHRLANLAERERYAHELSLLMKNRIGTKAENFAYITSGSSAPKSLYKTPAGSRGLIVVFYDSDCEKCNDLIENMKADQNLNNQIASGDLALLMVDIQSDRRKWENKAKDFPKGWIAGFNTDDIVGRDAYRIQSTPVIYILSPDYTVKDNDVNSGY